MKQNILKNTAALVLYFYYSCHVCLNMSDLAQLECLKLGCVFLTSPDIIIAIPKLYSTSEMVNRLLEQLKIDAELVSQEW